MQFLLSLHKNSICAEKEGNSSLNQLTLYKYLPQHHQLCLSQLLCQQDVLLSSYGLFQLPRTGEFSEGEYSLPVTTTNWIQTDQSSLKYSNITLLTTFNCFANSFYFLITICFISTHLLRIPFQLPHKKIDRNWLTPRRANAQSCKDFVSTTRCFRVWKQQKVTDVWLGGVFYGMYNNYDHF